MRYFLYQMHSSSRPPSGGDFREWLRYYKWGRPEIVTFRRSGTPLYGIAPGDVVFFTLDGFLIGDGLVAAVRDQVYITGVAGPVQEIDFGEGDVWEYVRSWGLLDRCLDWLRLAWFDDNEVPTWLGNIWSSGFSFCGSDVRRAVYDPEVPPAFFSIQKKRF